MYIALSLYIYIERERDIEYNDNDNNNDNDNVYIWRRCWRDTPSSSQAAPPPQENHSRFNCALKHVFGHHHQFVCLEAGRRSLRFPGAP